MMTLALNTLSVYCLWDVWVDVSRRLLTAWVWVYGRAHVGNIPGCHWSNGGCETEEVGEITKRKHVELSTEEHL